MKWCNFDLYIALMWPSRGLYGILALKKPFCIQIDQCWIRWEGIWHCYDLMDDIAPFKSVCIVASFSWLSLARDLFRNGRNIQFVQILMRWTEKTLISSQKLYEICRIYMKMSKFRKWLTLIFAMNIAYAIKSCLILSLSQKINICNLSKKSCKMLSS